MKKTYRIEQLNCAHCAAKMQQAIEKIRGVTAVSVNFIAQKLTLEAPDEVFEQVLASAVKACRRIEPDCRIIL